MDYKAIVNRFCSLLQFSRGDLPNMSKSMSDECQKHNSHMAHNGYLEHSPLWNGGECVAMVPVGSEIASAVFWMWKESPKHNQVLMSDYSEFGLAFYWSHCHVYATLRTR